MERVDAKVLAKHWRWEKDKDGLVWLTFDKQGESANTFSKQALQELSSTIEEISSSSPKGLIIRSAKEGLPVYRLGGGFGSLTIANGDLVGYGGGLERKRTLLDLESSQLALL